MLLCGFPATLKWQQLSITPRFLKQQGPSKDGDLQNERKPTSCPERQEHTLCGLASATAPNTVYECARDTEQVQDYRPIYWLHLELLRPQSLDVFHQCKVRGFR